MFSVIHLMKLNVYWHTLKKPSNKLNIIVWNRFFFIAQATWTKHYDSIKWAILFYDLVGKLLQTAFCNFSVLLCINRLPAWIHPLVAAQRIYFRRSGQAAKKLSFVCATHHRMWNTYRVGCPFAMIGELEQLCVSWLIHLLTLVILNLSKNQQVTLFCLSLLTNIFTQLFLIIIKTCL